MKPAAAPDLAQKILRRAALATRTTANLVAAPFEVLATRGADNAGTAAGPVFIIGLPRSGTTLLYQLLATALDVGYLTNRHCRWYRAPVLAEKMAPSRFGECNEFESVFGLTSGPHGPSECGNYWYRFLPRQPHSLHADAIDGERVRKLRRAVAALTAAAKRPLIFKNLILALRLPVVQRVFPKAVFVVSHRNAVDTGCSILMARQKRFGNLQQWFSARPRGCDNASITDDPFEQVATQIVCMDREMRQAREAAGDTGFVDVQYAELCSTPRSELERIRREIAARGIDVGMRENFDCPGEFAADRSRTSTPAEWRDRIAAALRTVNQR